MLKIIPTWPIAVGTLVIGLALGAGIDHLWMDGKVDRLTASVTKMKAEHAETLRVREVKRADDERAARLRESNMALRVGEIQQEKEDAIARTRTDADALIARLRKQAASKPTSPGGLPGAAPACQGAAGGELPDRSREDFVRLAQRAAELQAALGACYSAYDSVGR